MDFNVNLFEVFNDELQMAERFTHEINMGKRSDGFNGNKDKQKSGWIGEIVVRRLLRLKAPVPKVGNDNGKDIVFRYQDQDINIDVKTMGVNYVQFGNYESNLSKKQLEYQDTDIYVFCAFNKAKENFQIMGWIRKEEIKSEWLRPQGSKKTRKDGSQVVMQQDTYEIPNHRLREFDATTFKHKIVFEF